MHSMYLLLLCHHVIDMVMRNKVFICLKVRALDAVSYSVAAAKHYFQYELVIGYFEIN